MDGLWKDSIDFWKMGFASFATLCIQFTRQIQQVADQGYYERLAELKIPLPEPVGIRGMPGAKAWLAKSAPRELPRSISRSMAGEIPLYGGFDLFSKLSEWAYKRHLPADPDPYRAAARVKRWARNHAEAAGQGRSRGMSVAFRA